MTTWKAMGAALIVQLCANLFVNAVHAADALLTLTPGELMAFVALCSAFEALDKSQ